MPLTIQQQAQGGEAQVKGLPEEWDRVSWRTQLMSQRPHGGLCTQQWVGQGEGNTYFLSTYCVYLLCTQKQCAVHT